MPEQNSVLYNIAQSKSDQQKAQARSNIGVLHNVNYISNTVSPPTLAEVQAMLDAGDYVVLQYDSGTPGEPVVPMPVIQDYRGGSPFVMFCAVNDSGAITISLTGSGFGSASVNLFAVGKLDIITIQNNTATMSGLYTYIATAMGLGKTPIIKYEESTSPQTWGYYWPSLYETGAFDFRRVTGTGVLGIGVDSSNNITYTSVGYGGSVDCRLPIKVDGQGKITNNGYNCSVVGNNSWAEGNGTTSKGDYSHAEGRSTTADGEGAHAEGGADAHGDYSHGEGLSEADGNCSHAEGSTCVALAQCSHAEGSGTYSPGDDSHSEGETTISIGKNSHAEGQGYYYNRNITADATNTDRFFIDSATSISTGQWVILKDAITKVVTVDGLQIIVSDNVTVKDGDWVKFSSYAASGAASHTEGVNTSAIGTASHAEGFSTVATGNYSHSGGNGCNAKGEASMVHGGGLTMNTQYGSALGKFNQDYNALFVVGVGASGGSREDALKVDTNGHVWIRKNGTMVDLSI